MSTLRKITPLLGRCLLQELRTSSLPSKSCCSRRMAMVAKESSRLHKPTEFEKKVLVWTKLFKSAKDIPEEVTYATMKKAKDMFRIRANIAMTLGALVVGYGFMVWGRKDAEKGLTVQQQWRDMHKDYNERLTKSASDKVQAVNAGNNNNSSE